MRGPESGALDRTMYVFLPGSERNIPLLRSFHHILPRSLEEDSQLTVCHCVPGRRRYRSNRHNHLHHSQQFGANSYTISFTNLSSSSGCLNKLGTRQEAELQDEVQVRVKPRHLGHRSRGEGEAARRGFIFILFSFYVLVAGF